MCTNNNRTTLRRRFIMYPIRPNFNPYRTRYCTFSGIINTYVQTVDGRILNLNNFAGISIEQSNLMVVLKHPLPESVFPLIKCIISSYKNSTDANNAYYSLCAAIQRGYPFWNVNWLNQYIPYKMIF